MATIQKLLETAKNFQKQYPSAHIGGSLGLFLHGVYLGREMSKSDIDMTMREKYQTTDTQDYSHRSANDFDYCVMITDEVETIKIDLRISPEPTYCIIKFEGVTYNVSLLEDILYWKKKYAIRGSEKHYKDIENIKRICYEVLKLSTL